MNNTQFNIKKQQRIQAMHDKQSKQEQLRIKRLGEDIIRAQAIILELGEIIIFSQKRFDIYSAHYETLYQIYYDKHQLLLLAISRLHDQHPNTLSICTMANSRFKKDVFEQELEALKNHPARHIIKQQRDRLGLVHLEDKLIINETLLEKIEKNKIELANVKNYLDLLQSILEKIIFYVDNIETRLTLDGWPARMQQNMRRLLTSIGIKSTVNGDSQEDIF